MSMKESLIQDLESDSQFALEQVFDDIYRFVQEYEMANLPGLKLEYMVDDYSDIYE